MVRSMLRFVMGTAVVVGLVLGASALSQPVHAVIRPCICPDVYAPVTCSNGVTYSNSCRASCAHATGCHPSGDI